MIILNDGWSEVGVNMRWQILSTTIAKAWMNDCGPMLWCSRVLGLDEGGGLRMQVVLEQNPITLVRIRRQ